MDEDEIEVDEAQQSLATRFLLLRRDVREIAAHLMRVETEGTDDLDRFKTEVRGRLDRIDARQEKQLWAVIGLIITVATAIVTAGALDVFRGMGT